MRPDVIERRGAVGVLHLGEHVVAPGEEPVGGEPDLLHVIGRRDQRCSETARVDDVHPGRRRDVGVGAVGVDRPHRARQTCHRVPRRQVTRALDAGAVADVHEPVGRDHRQHTGRTGEHLLGVLVELRTELIPRIDTARPPELAGLDVVAEVSDLLPGAVVVRRPVAPPCPARVQNVVGRFTRLDGVGADRLDAVVAVVRQVDRIVPPGEEHRVRLRGRRRDRAGEERGRRPEQRRRDAHVVLNGYSARSRFASSDFRRRYTANVCPASCNAAPCCTSSARRGSSCVIRE